MTLTREELIALRARIKDRMPHHGPDAMMSQMELDELFDDVLAAMAPSPSEEQAEQVGPGLWRAKTSTSIFHSAPSASGLRAWQPIDTAPKDGQFVLIGFVELTARKRRRKSFVGEAEYHDGAWWWANTYLSEDGAIDPQPTHWMPLPDPPREGR